MFSRTSDLDALHVYSADVQVDLRVHCRARRRVGMRGAIRYEPSALLRAASVLLRPGLRIHGPHVLLQASVMLHASCFM